MVNRRRAALIGGRVPGGLVGTLDLTHSEPVMM